MLTMFPDNCVNYVPGCSAGAAVEVVYPGGGCQGDPTQGDGMAATPRGAAWGDRFGCTRPGADEGREVVDGLVSRGPSRGMWRRQVTGVRQPAGPVGGPRPN